MTNGRENPDLHHHHDRANDDIEPFNDRAGDPGGRSLASLARGSVGNTRRSARDAETIAVWPLNIWAVDKRVGNVKNDDVQLVQPV